MGTPERNLKFSGKLGDNEQHSLEVSRIRFEQIEAIFLGSSGFENLELASEALKITQEALNFIIAVIAKGEQSFIAQLIIDWPQLAETVVSILATLDFLKEKPIKPQEEAPLNSLVRLTKAWQAALEGVGGNLKGEGIGNNWYLYLGGLLFEHPSALELCRLKLQTKIEHPENIAEIFKFIRDENPTLTELAKIMYLSANGETSTTHFLRNALLYYFHQRLLLHGINSEWFTG